MNGILLQPNGLRPAPCDLHGVPAGAGVDSAWEQEKLEASLSPALRTERGARTVQGKLLENAARRGAAVPSVQCIIPVYFRDALLGVRLQALMLDIRSHQNRVKLQFFCPIRSFV